MDQVLILRSLESFLRELLRAFPSYTNFAMYCYGLRNVADKPWSVVKPFESLFL